MLVIVIDGEIGLSGQIIQNRFNLMGFKCYAVSNQSLDHLQEERCIHIIRDGQGKIWLLRIRRTQMDAMSMPTKHYLKGMASAMGFMVKPIVEGLFALLILNLQ